VTLPGPGAAALFVDLLLLALLAIGIGEPIRSLLGRRSAWLAGVDPVERALVDLYLGGGLVYVVAAVPLGLFYPPVIAAVALLPWGVRLALGPSPMASARSSFESVVRTVQRVPYLVGLAAFLALLAVEVAAAAPVPTGNTYDSSLYGLYSALLRLHHTLPMTLAPIDPVGVAFPQGPTAWFTFGGGVLALPPVRSSLLVTPLFLALGVPAGFAVGRRWWGSAEAGAAVALVFALLASFPRGIVAGSNDLVISLPLVLLLAAFARVWAGRAPPTWPDALVFGGLAGYAAALNPVGPQWLFLTILVAGVLAAPRLGGTPLAWLARFVGAVAVALVFVAPTLDVLAIGHSSPGFIPGGATPPAGAPFGTSVAQFFGGIDPFLFRPADTWLSPFPVLRAELAILIGLGAGLLLAGAYGRLPVSRAFGRFALSGGLVAILVIGAYVPAQEHLAGFSQLVYLSSATEMSIVLFLVYTLVAAVPLIVVFERLARRPATTPAPAVSGRRRFLALQVDRPEALAIVLALAILLPGAGVTAFSLPGQLQSSYENFSNVTTADLAMLEYGAGILPAGSRVLVAPGSAAEFLPSYDPNIVLLYPMVPNYGNVNASYTLLVRELTNNTLDLAGQAALADLNVGFVAVTERNSVLFAPFAAPPLVGDPGFHVVFQQGDAWLFEANSTAYGADPAA
jgi:hypothetical protein